jgi:FMN phosphatase YigB (HAD superfamily)
MAIQNQMIKAIFFDLDGTLRHSVPSGGDVFTQYAISLGLNANGEDAIRALRREHLYWANSADLRDDLLAHSGETDSFWIEYSRRRLVALGSPPAWAVEAAPKMSAHMSEIYQPESIVPEDALRILPALKEAGYILAVISNRDKPFVDTLEKLGIKDYFTFSLAGGEVDSYKPGVEIFEHGLKRAGMTAQETVYVGDNYFADIVGSRRAGLRPVLYDPICIFPDADCAVIKSFDDLIPTIKTL